MSLYSAPLLRDQRERFGVKWQKEKKCRAPRQQYHGLYFRVYASHIVYPIYPGTPMVGVFSDLIRQLSVGVSDIVFSGRYRIGIDITVVPIPNTSSGNILVETAQSQTGSLV